MQCPHCEKEIAGSPCPNCGGATGYAAANYCMACGSPLKEDLEKVPTRDDDLEEEGGLDLDNRVLCPDGTCTGIIVDGKCSECGRAVGPDGEFIHPDTTPMAGAPSGVGDAKRTG